MSKEQKTQWRRNIGWAFVRTCVAINSLLSLRANYRIGYLLGYLAYRIVGRQRLIALESLAVAFPEKALTERKRIARDFFIFMVQGSFELLYVLRHPGQLRGVRLQGLEYLKEALAAGRGVVLVTAHIGNFPLLSLKLARLGIPVNFVTMPMRDKRVGDYLCKLRTNAGVKTIYSYPRRDCVSSIISALRANEVVILQIDQNFGSGGVWVRFFGRLAATPAGPIALALRTKAALVPAYIWREQEDRHCLQIYPPQPLAMRVDKDETILYNVVAITRIVESWIRQHPGQWGWIHKRWKSRPSAKVLAAKGKVEQ